MSRVKQLVLSAVLVGASLVLGLAVAEVAVRTLAPQPTGLAHQDRYGLALHYPGITRFLPQYGHEVSFNSVGMRDREHPLVKPAGTYRVLLLGDSFMEALQVPADSMLASLMEQGLSQVSGRTVEVINAGVSGWGTDDELRYLSSYGLAYKPDLVVIAMTLHNDISDNLRRQWHTLREGKLVDRNPPPMSAFQYKVTQLKAFLATRFQLYQLWRRIRHGGEIRQVGRSLNAHVVQLLRDSTTPTIAMGMALTEPLLRQIRDTTRSAGGRVAVVLLPLKYQLSDSVFAEFVKQSEVPPAEMRLTKPQDLLKGVADSLQVPVIDLLPAFRDWTARDTAQLYLGWDGHWNDAGHQLAAREVIAGLLKAGLLAPGARADASSLAAPRTSN